MSETQTAPVAPEITDPMQKMQFDTLTMLIGNFNKLAESVNAATGDKESLAKTIREHEDFADLRNQIAELENQLDAAVNERVEARLSDDSGDVEALTKQAVEEKAKVTTGLSFYSKLFGKEAVKALPKVGRIKGKSGGGKSGGRRIRGYNWIVNLNGTTTECENAASAAKLLGIVSTEQLQEQFFAKAGVEKVKDAPDEVLMTLDWEDTNEDGSKKPNHADIKVYRTGPSGPPTAGNAEPTVDEPADTTEPPSEEDLENAGV